MHLPNRDGDGVRQVWRHIGLSVSIASPRRDGSIVSERGAVITAATDCHGIGQIVRDNCLAETRIAPDQHGGAQGELLIGTANDPGEVAGDQTVVVHVIQAQAIQWEAEREHPVARWKVCWSRAVGVSGVGAPLEPGEGRLAARQDHSVQHRLGGSNGLGRLGVNVKRTLSEQVRDAQAVDEEQRDHEPDTPQGGRPIERACLIFHHYFGFAAGFSSASRFPQSAA